MQFKLFRKGSIQNGSYSSYEINLVLGDSSRFHLVDHGNYAQIQTDSEILSGILGNQYGM